MKVLFLMALLLTSFKEVQANALCGFPKKFIGYYTYNGPLGGPGYLPVCLGTLKIKRRNCNAGWITVYSYQLTNTNSDTPEEFCLNQNPQGYALDYNKEFDAYFNARRFKN